MRKLQQSFERVNCLCELSRRRGGACVELKVQQLLKDVERQVHWWGTNHLVHGTVCLFFRLPLGKDGGKIELKSFTPTQQV